ncbi:hypothetical protein PYW07_008951 [Mythimna separata]|uniref:Cyclin-like domain-containing protein n=1 Tax=Mythimna separata TaxID=271217 RepID=A0AAD7YB97_MYTSE|nr:hypothetical protein PYW07_008951 [Mythimna separata]
MATSRRDTDKENVHKTRIPVPKDPLPALPKRLLVEHKMVHKEDIPHRSALKTLNAPSSSIYNAGPSKIVPYKSHHPLNLDTRHVTLRQTSVDLDWHYTVFKDKRAEDKDASTVSISDDETYLAHKSSQRKFVGNKRENTLGSVSSAITPNLKACLEPNRIKNIKKSLKRPSSRELQGLSPPLQDTSHKLDDNVKRRLKFNESVHDKLKPPDFWKRSYMQSLNRDLSADVFEYLLANESKPLNVPRTSSTNRACVINWLMKVNGVDGNPAVIQSACWYLDSILGTRFVRLEKLQLVAVACFWIAQKLNGPFMPAKRLANYSGGVFTADDLVDAERAVLIRLKFPKQPIVPQDYIPYLSWWCDSQKAGEIEVAATFLAMCGLMVDRVLCEEYPSVIAVAAVRSALVLLRKKELIARLQMCNIFSVAEKKATTLSYTCSILRRAVRTVSTPIYEYKTPLEHYGMPPCCIAQRIICAINDDEYFRKPFNVLKP